MSCCAITLTFDSYVLITGGSCTGEACKLKERAEYLGGNNFTQRFSFSLILVVAFSINMQYSTFLVRPQALVGILITTLGILSFQAVCEIYLPSSTPSIANCSILSQSTSQMIGNYTSTPESSIQQDAILAAISELSNSFSQMNASLTSLHAKLAQESNPVNDPESKQRLRATQKWPSPKSTTMSAQETVIVCSIVPAISFLVGILIFLEDAACISKSFATRCFLVMIGMANIGLASVVFGTGRSGLERYIYGTAWSVALSMAGLALYEASCMRTQLVAERVKR